MTIQSNRMKLHIFIYFKFRCPFIEVHSHSRSRIEARIICLFQSFKIKQFPIIDGIQSRLMNSETTIYEIFCQPQNFHVFIQNVKSITIIHLFHSFYSFISFIHFIHHFNQHSTIKGWLNCQKWFNEFFFHIKSDSTNSFFSYQKWFNEIFFQRFNFSTIHKNSSTEIKW